MNQLTSLSAFFPAYNVEANVERMVQNFKMGSEVSLAEMGAYY